MANSIPRAGAGRHARSKCLGGIEVVPQFEGDLVLQGERRRQDSIARLIQIVQA